MDRLKTRAQFLAVAKGRRVARDAFVLQLLGRTDALDAAPRVGFTVTKKLGHAVVRNRIRRRLREAVRLEAAAGQFGQTGLDYVVIARDAARTMKFEGLRAALRAAAAAPPTPSLRR